MLDFHGRVALVTGGARGLGESYVRLLCDRGATVIVNDLGSAVDGSGVSDGPARSLVDEMSARHLNARAAVADVSDPSAAQAMVEAAVEEFGHLDIVINNAGILSPDTPPNLNVDNLRRHFDIHVVGSANVTMAAWPHLERQKYGRVVMTASSGMFGQPSVLSYGVAKAGIVGLAKALAVLGEPSGIKVNVIAPTANTRMVGDPDGRLNESLEGRRHPSRVAPTVGYLAHETCPVNGEILLSGSGRTVRVFFGASEGWVAPGDGSHSIEDIAAQWDQIVDPSRAFIPSSTNEWRHYHEQRAAEGISAGG